MIGGTLSQYNFSSFFQFSDAKYSNTHNASQKFNPWTVFCPLYVRVCLASLYPRDLGNSYTHALEVSTPLDTFRPLFMHVCLASCIRSDLGNSYIHALEVYSQNFAFWLLSVTFELLISSSMSTQKFTSNIFFELLYLSRSSCLASWIHSDLGNSYIHALEVSK